jgi:hypothetical protein
MTAFEFLGFRGLVALVACVGAWLCSKIAELWTCLSHDRDIATNPIGQPRSGGNFPVGQPQGFIRHALWLNYRQGGDSRWRTALWPSLGSRRRWSLAVLDPSSLPLRGPMVDGGRTLAG